MSNPIRENVSIDNTCEYNLIVFTFRISVQPTLQRRRAVQLWCRRFPAAHHFSQFIQFRIICILLFAVQRERWPDQMSRIELPKLCWDGECISLLFSICALTDTFVMVSAGPIELFRFDIKLRLEFIAVRVLQIFSAHSDDCRQMFPPEFNSNRWEV